MFNREFSSLQGTSRTTKKQASFNTIYSSHNGHPNMTQPNGSLHRNTCVPKILIPYLTH